jgi:hypothetical protein
MTHVEVHRNDREFFTAAFFMLVNEMEPGL